MQLVAHGINHRTAPLEIREQVAFVPEEIPAALERLRADGLAAEVVLLSTCNRTEFYAVTKDPEAVLDHQRRLVRELKGVDLTAHRLAYVQRHRDAVEHLFRVAGGIDSMVVGETAILGQVKTAFEAAVDGGATGPVFARLFATAMRVGKRARSETEIGRGAVSVEKSAIQLAQKVYGDMGSRSALILGAGDSGQRVAGLLREAGVQSLSFANRTTSKAEDLAKQFDGNAVAWDALAPAISETSVVVTAVSATEPVLGRDVLKRALENRRKGPLLVLDLGVPRNVDPAAAKLTSLFLYSVDDFQELVEHNLGKRREEIPAVERIVTEEADRFFEWVASLETAPVLVAMREEADRIRRETLERFGKGLDTGERELLERFSKGLVNKLMHHPTVAVRGCDTGTREGIRGLDWARRLFGLDPGAAENGSDPQERSGRGQE